MSFRLRWTPAARGQFDALDAAAQATAEKRRRTGQTKSSRPEGLFAQVRKAARLLQENPRHPGLQTHEFLSLPHPYDERGKVFEAYVQNRTPGAWRIFWCYGPGKDEITIIALAPHP